MASERTDLKGVFHIGDSQLMNELETNLKFWLDWGFLRIGGWQSITPSTADGYSSDLDRLRPIDIIGATGEVGEWVDGQVWEGVRKDWVWETAVNYQDRFMATQNPTQPSAQATVDSVLTSYSYIDYNLGRVIFPSALSTSAVVTMSYSYRNVQVYVANKNNWWQSLHYDSFINNTESKFHSLGGGNWGIDAQHRVQMPAIMIEAVPRARSRGYQLGDGSYWVQQDVLCTVLAETRDMRNKITDILRGQFHNTIWLFDSDEVSVNGDWPLDYRGALVDNTKTYTALVDKDTGHRWVKCHFVNTSVEEVQPINSKLFQGQVRLTCEVVLPD